jgi:hypothetical protein
MSFLKLKKRLSALTKRKSAENVPLDEVPASAFERVSDLEKDSKWPSGSSSHSGSPGAIRKKLEKAANRNQVPCDIIDAGEMTKAQIFAQRGFDINPKTRKTRILGEGAFGYVELVGGKRLKRAYLQEEETPNPEKEVLYACKVLQQEKSKKGKPFEKRLRELANELRGLNAGHSHPYITQLLDAFIDRSTFYIIMELAEGVS